MDEYIEREALSLDEAIAHCEERAKLDCSPCAEQHKQLAEWLKELKKYKFADFAPVVHAQWVPKRKMYRTPHAKNYTCSECGLATEYRWNYCHNCGARMDGKSHNDER